MFVADSGAVWDGVRGFCVCAADVLLGPGLCLTPVLCINSKITAALTPVTPGYIIITNEPIKRGGNDQTKPLNDNFAISSIMTTVLLSHVTIIMPSRCIGDLNFLSY